MKARIISLCVPRSSTYDVAADGLVLQDPSLLWNIRDVLYGPSNGESIRSGVLAALDENTATRTTCLTEN